MFRCSLVSAPDNSVSWHYKHISQAFAGCWQLTWLSTPKFVFIMPQSPQPWEFFIYPPTPFAIWWFGNIPNSKGPPHALPQPGLESWLQNFPSPTPAIRPVFSLLQRPGTPVRGKVGTKGHCKEGLGSNTAAFVSLRIFRELVACSDIL